MMNMIKYLLLSSFFLMSGFVSAESDSSCVFVQNTFCGDCEGSTLFQPDFSCPIKACKCIIYDRWGAILYESTTLKPEFETFGLKDGTYFYQLKGKYASGKDFNIESRFNYFR